jgi:hypothetical protein
VAAERLESALPARQLEREFKLSGLPSGLSKTDTFLLWIFNMKLKHMFCGGVVLLLASGIPAARGQEAAAAAETRTVSFQQGVNGYTGTIDTEIWALAPHTILESNPNSSTDADNDGGESQCLLRFDNIIGSAAWQVPPRAAVVKARLLVSAFDQGSTVNLHRMLVPFDRSATWSSLVAGVSADGLEACRHKDAFTFGKIAANSSEIIFDVTDTVQLWAGGEANHGWVFLNTGGNGWDFYASEFSDVKQRPRLVVEFVAPAVLADAAAAQSAAAVTSSR